jgi:hypothetical protein
LNKKNIIIIIMMLIIKSEKKRKRKKFKNSTSRHLGDSQLTHKFLFLPYNSNKIVYNSFQCRSLSLVRVWVTRFSKVRNENLFINTRVCSTWQFLKQRKRYEKSFWKKNEINEDLSFSCRCFFCVVFCIIFKFQVSRNIHLDTLIPK